MRSPGSRVQLLRDLRFALEVMEERSHLGLDDDRAKAMKSALLHRINQTELGLNLEPANGMSLVADEVLTA
jgi:hypothetical protein